MNRAAVAVVCLVGAVSASAQVPAPEASRADAGPEARLPEVSSPDGKPNFFTTYKPKGLFNNGYWSREAQPGHWIVNARVYGHEEPSRAFMIALYRAAELVKAAGFEKLRINGQVLKTTYAVSRSAVGTSRHNFIYLAILNVVAVGSPSSGEPCLMGNPRACPEMTVAQAFQAAGPKIGMSPSPEGSEAAQSSAGAK